jgi:hypothetical protein
MKDPTMDSKDIIRISRRAKNETEAFINRYLNDRAKGWPKLCLCRSTDTWSDRRRPLLTPVTAARIYPQ